MLLEQTVLKLNHTRTIPTPDQINKRMTVFIFDVESAWSWVVRTGMDRDMVVGRGEIKIVSMVRCGEYFVQSRR